MAIVSLFNSGPWSSAGLDGSWGAAADIFGYLGADVLIRGNEAALSSIRVRGVNYAVCKDCECIGSLRA